MAKMYEEVLIIKISTLLPDDVAAAAVMTEDNIAALQQVIEQLADQGKTLVEIDTAR